MMATSDAEGPTGEPRIIHFFTRPGCHLCQEALQVLIGLQAEFCFEIRRVDISTSPDLERRYGQDIPVATLEDQVILKHRANPGRLRRLLGR